MNVRQEKGISGIDITISILMLTIFVTLITNISIGLDKNTKIMQRKTQAISYAIDLAEQQKRIGYQENLKDKGLTGKEIIEEKDIYDENKKITGFYQTIYVQDYISFTGNETKQKNQVKKITVEISFKVGNQIEKVSLEILLAKE